MPRTSNFFRIPMGKDVKVLVKPQMITTSEKLRNFDPKRRQCVYESERKLRYFKTYTQHHCGKLRESKKKTIFQFKINFIISFLFFEYCLDMECTANFTYWRCGCVKFSLPSECGRSISNRIRLFQRYYAKLNCYSFYFLKGGEEMSLCGAGRLHCYREAEDELLRRTTMDECNCLPACTSTDYNVEISEREFDEFNRINADMNYQRWLTINWSIILAIRLFLFFFIIF